MNVEDRNFSMHQNLLYNVIMRQAGSLQKAILEGVMNSIDAGATVCHVTMDTHSFSIVDDGRGFQTLQEVEEHFDVFGTPHEEGDAIYGHFRMGRGQIMAFGKNVWRSRHFEMRVDIKGRGTGYKLYEHKDFHPGTRVDVELYDPLRPSDLERHKAEVRRFVAWAPIPVMLNGIQVSTDPRSAKWDFEDEDAYYSLSSERQQLAIYNLGVLVTSVYAGPFGVGGTVVSKKQLEINLARNDVQSSCPVFKRIGTFIKKNSGKAAAKKTKLTDAERELLVRDFLAGEMEVDTAAKLRVITDVNGRNWPIDKLAQIPDKFGGQLVVADRGDLMIETAQRRNIAFSIDQSTLERFGASDGEAFLQRIAACAQLCLDNSTERGDYLNSYRLGQIASALPEQVTVVNRAFLGSLVSELHTPVEDKDLTPDMKLLKASIERGYEQMIRALNKASYEDRRFEMRNIRLGRSSTALAWTDGKKTIWLDVEHARLLRRGYSGAFQIASTLLHEMLHEGPDTGTHQHDMDFYKAFHDMTAIDEDPLGLAADRMITMFLAKLRQNQRKISKKLLARDDADLVIATVREAVDAG